MMRTFQYRKLWLTIGWSGVCLLIYLSLTPLTHHVLTFKGGFVIEHIPAYGVTMAWFGQLYPSARSRSVIAATLIVAAPLLKFIQRAMWHFPYFEYGDVASGIAGVVLGLLLLQTSLGNVLHFVDSWLQGR
ncbi:MAG: hypothetical protein ACYDBH_06025 [Acidobacteriaceae bacterium]